VNQCVANDTRKKKCCGCRAQTYHYVGKVANMSHEDSDKIVVDFLRFAGSAFLFPVVSDKYAVSRGSIIMKLTLKDVTRGHHSFLESLEGLIIRWLRQTGHMEGTIVVRAV
jgi:hypothetical protein